MPMPTSMLCFSICRGSLSVLLHGQLLVSSSASFPQPLFLCLSDGPVRRRLSDGPARRCLSDGPVRRCLSDGRACRPLRDGPACP